MRQRERERDEEKRSLKRTIGYWTPMIRHIKSNMMPQYMSIDWIWFWFGIYMHLVNAYTHTGRTWWFHFLYSIHYSLTHWLCVLFCFLFLFFFSSLFMLFTYRSTVRTNNIWLCRRFNYTRGIYTKVSLYIVWWQPVSNVNMVQEW